MVDERRVEAAIWSIADGRGSDADLALVRVDERGSLAVLDRLIVEAEEDLASVQSLRGDERAQVVADFHDTIDSLRAAAAVLRQAPTGSRGSEPDAVVAIPCEELEPGEVQLQVSWSAGQLVVWAGARGAPPEANDALATRLEAIGGPPVGWQLHPGVVLPGGVRAEALTIPMKDALGWLVAVGGGHGRGGVGASVLWLGHVALEGVRLVARGSVVPSLRVANRPDGRLVDAAVRWRPALTDSPTVEALARSMPGTVAAVDGGSGRATAIGVISAVVEAIVTESVERMELPAPPPSVDSPSDLADAVIARMDGSLFRAQARLATDVAKRLDHWSHTVTSRTSPGLVVRLDEPGAGGVWLVSVHAPAGKGKLVTIDAALESRAHSRPGGGGVGAIRSGSSRRSIAR